jgi:hypothetical protein
VQAALSFVRTECERDVDARKAAADARAKKRQAPEPELPPAADGGVVGEGESGESDEEFEKSKPKEYKVFARASLVPFQGGQLLTFGVDYTKLGDFQAQVVNNVSMVMVRGEGGLLLHHPHRPAACHVLSLSLSLSLSLTHSLSLSLCLMSISLTLSLSLSLSHSLTLSLSLCV